MTAYRMRGTDTTDDSGNTFTQMPSTNHSNQSSGTTTRPSGSSSSSHSNSSQSRSSASGIPVEICVSTHAKSTVSSRIRTGWSVRQPSYSPLTSHLAPAWKVRLTPRASLVADTHRRGHDERLKRLGVGLVICAVLRDNDEHLASLLERFFPLALPLRISDARSIASQTIKLTSPLPIGTNACEVYGCLSKKRTSNTLPRVSPTFGVARKTEMPETALESAGYVDVMSASRAYLVVLPSGETWMSWPSQRVLGSGNA